MSERKTQQVVDGKLLKWLMQREDEMAGLLAEFVAVPTENPPGNNYCACAELLEQRLKGFDLQCDRVKVGIAKREDEDSTACLSASYGTGERTLYFHGHYDVVPAQSQEQFAALRKGHFLFGRGTCDMKGGIVAMLYAILALRECGVKLNGKIKLMLVPDEETGGARGSAWLAKRGLLGRDGIGMLTAEPTSGVVWDANRGAISLRVEVFGKSAHVGLQHKGENAFERMHLVVERLQELRREVEQRVTGLDVGEDQARNSILLIGGQSGGGTNFNVVPDRCWFTIDRRINPEEDLAAEKTRILDVLEGCKRNGIPLAWGTLQEGSSASSRQDEPLGKAIAEAIKEKMGESARFELCPGLLETRFYAARGIPAYAYGPGLLSVAHGPNEYVDLRKVIECAGIYAEAARKLLASN
ncbi:MAG TPA: ArgE/DapE family deacylase [Candidatus Acidoferrum sp.]|jgi:acetylornithine deacetylase/succinyl-diaminopimelate desuccinylase family protein|nr:ArgE/DapE family deacylase [Candidatus Acidoferrum sp.]